MLNSLHKVSISSLLLPLFHKTQMASTRLVTPAPQSTQEPPISRFLLGAFPRKGIIVTFGLPPVGSIGARALVEFPTMTTGKGVVSVAVAVVEFPTMTTVSTEIVDVRALVTLRFGPPGVPGTACDGGLGELDNCDDEKVPEMEEKVEEEVDEEEEEDRVDKNLELTVGAIDTVLVIEGPVIVENNAGCGVNVRDTTVVVVVVKFATGIWDIRVGFSPPALHVGSPMCVINDDSASRLKSAPPAP